MKRFITLLVAAALLFAAAVPAAAVSISDSAEVMSAKLPDDYLVITSANLQKRAEILAHWGHSVDSFKRMMNEKNIFVYAMDKGSRNQFQLKSWVTDAATAIGDLAIVSEEALGQSMAAIAGEIGEGALLDSRVVYADKQPFFKFTVDVGDFCYVQYLTVCDSRFYALVYYNDTAELTPEQAALADEVFATVEVDSAYSSGLFSSSNVFTVILLGSVMLAAAAGIVWVIATFIQDIRRRRAEPDEYIPDHIEMRRK